MPYYKILDNNMQAILHNKSELSKYEIGQFVSASKTTADVILPSLKYAINFCEGASNLSFWHFGHELGTDIRFVQVEPKNFVNSFNKNNSEMEFYSEEVQVIREVPKNEFAKICIKEFSNKNDSYLNMLNWISKIKTGLFENKCFSHLHFANVQDIEDFSFKGTVVQNLYLMDFLKPEIGIKKISAGMLDGITIERNLILGLNTVIEPGALRNTNITNIRFGKNCNEVPANIANRNGAKFDLIEKFSNISTKRMYSGSAITDAYGNLLQNVKS